jgi:phage-related protein
MIKVFELLGTLEADTSRFNSALTKAERSAVVSAGKINNSFSTLATKTGRVLENAGSQMAKAGSLLTSKITKPALIAGGAVAAIFLKAGWDRLVQIDTARAKLEALKLSAKDVDSIMESAKDSVLGTAYSLGDAATAAAAATASGVESGKEMNRYLGLVVDTAAASGTALNEIGMIFGKLQARGKMSNIENRMFMERQIPVQQWLQKELRVTTAEYAEMQAAGEISSEMVYKAVEKYYGGAAKIMGAKSITAAMQNVKAAIARAGEAFLDAGKTGGGFFSQLKGHMVGFTQLIDSMNDKFAEWGKIFGAKVASMIKSVKSLYSYYKSLSEGTQELIKKVVKFGAIFLVSFGPALSIAGKVTTAVGGVSKAVGFLTGVLGSKTVATAADTAATGINTAATKVNDIAHSTGTRSILGWVAAHKLASVAILGGIGLIIGLGVAFFQAGGDVDQLAEKIQAFAHKAATAISAFTAKLPQLMPQITEAITTAINGFAAAVPTIMPHITAALTSIINAFVNTIPALVPTLVTAFTTVLMAIVDAVPVILPPLIEGVITLVNAIVAALPELLSPLITAFTTLLLSIVEAIPKLIPPLINAIPPLITLLVNALVAAVPQLINGAITLLLALVEAIPKIIPPLIQALPTIITSLVNALVAAVPQLIEGAIKLLMALVEAIPKIIPKLIAALPKIIKALVTGLVKAIPELIKGAVKLLGAIVKAIPKVLGAIGKIGLSIVKGIWKGLSGAVGWIVKKLGGFGKKILDGIGKALTKVLDLGKKLVEGLWKGIKGAATWIKDKLKGFAGGIVKGVKSFFGIKSPSKVFAEIGASLMAGLGAGIDKGAKKVKAVVHEVAKSVATITKKVVRGDVDAVKSAIKELNKNLSLTNSIRKFETAIIDTAKKITNMKDKIKEAKEALKQYKEAMRQYAEGIANTFTSFGGLGDIKASGIEGFITGLQTNLKTAQSFAAKIQALAKLGLNQSAIDEIIAKGVTEGSALADKLLAGANTKTIARINQLMKGIENIGVKLGKSLSKRFYGAGKDAAIGLVNGLKSKEKALEAQAKKMADKITKTLKGALKIKSPSQVFIGIGEMATEGLAVGLSRTKKVINSLSALTTTVTEGMTSALSSPAFSTTPIITEDITAVVKPSETGVYGLLKNTNTKIDALTAAVNQGKTEMSDSLVNGLKDIARNMQYMKWTVGEREFRRVVARAKA